MDNKTHNIRILILLFHTVYTCSNTSNYRKFQKLKIIIKNVLSLVLHFDFRVAKLQQTDRGCFLWVKEDNVTTEPIDNMVEHSYNKLLYNTFLDITKQ